MKPKPKLACPASLPARIDQESDERLVELALGGDRQAFQSLVRRHQRALVNHIYRHTGKRDGALDLAQEVFLKVYLSLSSFDPTYRFTTWLYRIASNCAIDHLRKKKPQTCPLHADASDDRASRTAVGVTRWLGGISNHVPFFGLNSWMPPSRLPSAEKCDINLKSPFSRVYHAVDPSSMTSTHSDCLVAGL